MYTVSLIFTPLENRTFCYETRCTNLILTAWVTELMTGATVNEATVSVFDKKQETNQQGLCTMQNFKIENNEQDILVVEKDEDLCMLVIHTSYRKVHGKYTSHRRVNDKYTSDHVWHVFNDRGLYKPNEEVHVEDVEEFKKNMQQRDDFYEDRGGGGGGGGRVGCYGKLLDNLTRYRVWALAVNDKQCGLGETSFTVQLPIMVRPLPPRFLNYGDIAHFSVILQNQTDLSLPLHVGLRASNAKLLALETNQQGIGYSIVLKASKRVVVTFPVSTIHSGAARFRFLASVVNNKTYASCGDAIELSLPIFPLATSETFATYGDVDEKKVILQPIKTPKDVIAQFGELSISTSSTALASLTDAIISLYTYLYECIEQISSRLLGIQALWDVLQAFHCKDLPEVSALKTKLESDMNVLKSRQYPNGGFGYWTSRTDYYADPYMSVHVVHCLAAVIDKESEKVRYSLMSYALYVRAKHNRDVAREASRLFKRSGFDKLSLEALGWLLVALSTGENENIKQTVKIIYNHLKGKVSETSETANFITSYESLLYIDPKSSLCTKLCKDLQAHKVKDAWKSTQENCFVLIALNKYFRMKEKDIPEFAANIWLDTDYCGQHQYK
ncbi:unnamed protein product, partial [Didymodactylos carnosus]